LVNEITPHGDFGDEKYVFGDQFDDHCQIGVDERIALLASVEHC